VQDVMPSAKARAAAGNVYLNIFFMTLCSYY